MFYEELPLFDIEQLLTAMVEKKSKYRIDYFFQDFPFMKDYHEAMRQLKEGKTSKPVPPKKKYCDT